MPGYYTQGPGLNPVSVLHVCVCVCAHTVECVVYSNQIPAGEWCSSSGPVHLRYSSFLPSTFLW